MGRTEQNLEAAFTGEARANRHYVAYAYQAMQEGHPEIAQLFLEAAGAETIHALNHLKVLGALGDTEANLDESANGEGYEIDEMYPRFIAEAEEDGRTDAAATFRLAVERERHHRDMFREALAQFRAGMPVAR
ncbi:MAG TPA: rubrerythrin family protein [Thermomicrobiaceae bacterium]|nr:rubrerythrin family protein [Thermomicrobiaceae bacterium]